jgi:hypothetical protein
MHARIGAAAVRRDHRFGSLRLPSTPLGSLVASPVGSAEDMRGLMRPLFAEIPVSAAFGCRTTPLGSLVASPVGWAP